MFKEFILTVFELMALTIMDKNLRFINNFHFAKLLFWTEKCNSNCKDTNDSETSKDSIV
jgi:hypothetical protein